MIRVLFLARYRDANMRAKVHYLAESSDYEILFAFPRQWSDELLTVEQPAWTAAGIQTMPLQMFGRTNDPHRSAYRSFTFALHRFQPHIIHAEEEPDSIPALQIAIARQLFAPSAKLLLHTWQNIDRRRAWYVRGVTKTTLAASDAVFCANQEAVDILRRHGYAKPLPLIPAVGVDTVRFNPCPQRTESDRFVIGFLGRLVPEKGIDTLLDACALLKQRIGRPITVRLVGGGPEQVRLKEQASRLALEGQVEFLGPQDPSSIATILCGLDLLVLPSRTTRVWKEQLGRVLVEAMACTIPVIGSDSGAIPEVIGDGGIVFPEGDATALAAQIDRLRSDPAFCAKLGAAGRHRAVTVYSQRSLADRTLAVYHDICS